MKFLRLLHILVLTIGISASALAQPVNINVRLTQPPPNQLKVADLWKIDLDNRSGQKVRVYLRGTAEEMSVPDGIIAEAHSAEFDCPPGGFRISAAQISPIELDQSNDRYKDALLSTGNVPTGEYKVCVEVIDAETQQVIGQDCKFTTVNRMSVPILIAPPDESDVPDRYPVFSWMASVPPGPRQIIKYRIVIAEMFGTQTPADAIRRNPAWFQQRNLTRTMLMYPISSRNFTPGQRYAWMIEAYEERGEVVVSLGESEIWWFTWKPMDNVNDDGNDRRDDLTSAPAKPEGECPGENWDFEIGSLACWEPLGEAYIDDPVLDVHPVLGPVGQQGKYWTSSYGPINAERAQGTLLSQEFTIQNSTLQFLFGGRPDDQCRVELLMEQTAADTFSMPTRSLAGTPRPWYILSSTNLKDAASADRLSPIEWNMLKYLNRKARIYVIDSSKSGYVSVDDFKFIDKEKVDTVKYPVLVMAAGEAHSLVATPEDKPNPKLWKDLTASVSDMQRGRMSVEVPTVVNETSQSFKGSLYTMLTNIGTETNIQGGGGGGGNEQAAGNQESMSDFKNLVFTEGISSKLSLSVLAALIVKNQVWGWGNNTKGAVGPSLPWVVKEPAKVKGIQHVTALDAGVWNSFGVEKDGTLKGWGDNEYAQLGVGDRSRRSTPTVVPGITKVAKVANGAYHSVASTTEGKLYTWGWNRTYACGSGFNDWINGTTGQVDSTVFFKQPYLQSKVVNVVDVAAGEAHGLVATSRGTVWAWGSNSHGQTGRDTSEQFTVSIQSLKVGNGVPIYSVSAGFDHSMALDAGGTVWAWGGNASGQLGDGTFTDRWKAKKVDGLPKIRAIAAGDGFSLALDSTGHVWAWGNNVLGQLGNGTRVGSDVPVQVSRLDAVTGIVAGGAHAMAVRTDGGLWTWGTNADGQLGEGPITNLTPVPLNPPLGPLRVERLATK